MKQVVIVLHISTQEEKRISINDWRIIREQEKKTKIKVYELVDIVDENTITAPKKRSLNLSASTARKTTIQTPPKKKKCCGG